MDLQIDIPRFKFGSYDYKKKQIRITISKFRELYPSRLEIQFQISNFDNIHLLGCNLPQEFGWYSNYPFIKSIDTSNPVMAALDGVSYWDFGLLGKPYSNMNMEFDRIDEKLILENANKFREINGYLEK